MRHIATAGAHLAMRRIDTAGAGLAMRRVATTTAGLAMRRIAIAGAGLAGLTAAQELRRLGYDGEISLVGAERHRPYRRPPLSKEFLLDPEADVALPGTGELGATWLLGQPATGLDLAGRRLLRGALEPVAFDGLIIATGARARTLPGTGARARTLPGTAGLPGVVTLRGLDDARALRAALGARPRVVIAGAGFLGSELAATLRSLDLPVTLVEPGRVPLRRPLGERLGAVIADLHRAHGVDLRLGRRVAAAAGTGRVEHVRLDDGTVLPADLLVVALGAEPELGWLHGSGLRLDGGVVTDRHGLAAPGVAAAGDVARRPSVLLGGELVRVEHYSAAVEQGAHAARSLLGAAAPPGAVPSFWCDLYGHRLRSVGVTGTGYRPRLVHLEPDGRFLVEYQRDGRVVGAVTAGFVRHLSAYRHLLAEAYA
ncbi:NAD(P)/FAD-dependent oxidoreductase [Nonomuraea rubra]|uniref:NADPH-dependent 2,4-dienoyl-CoA reductase/sulfur reductase-like enzyme n=1 Tax=Nonomuraea rubra TaxID=46180 RepID=A0A7X0U2C1_9ACTN|nr:FAD-dependent oxidoreductase [Nonomuraea rubra]MBB6552632.1 NADPH-dependent 2,4-dienoyl-CoA reductase/sulfur reductase-like enzyme [Nonomuraea rubra]